MQRRGRFSFLHSNLDLHAVDDKAYSAVLQDIDGKPGFTLGGVYLLGFGFLGFDGAAVILGVVGILRGNPLDP